MANCCENAEAWLMEAAIPSIKKICIGRWYNLEYQDRVSEARQIFIEDLRAMPLNTGHFLEDFRADLDVKMQARNRSMPSLRFGRYSLDSVYSSKIGEYIDGYNFIAAPQSGFDGFFFREFLRSLLPLDRRIAVLLMDGFFRSEVSNKLDLSVSQLDQAMEEIGRLYKLWDSE